MTAAVSLSSSIICVSVSTKIGYGESRARCALNDEPAVTETVPGKAAEI
jgi:hypothetical protein